MIFVHGVWVLLTTRFYTSLNEESIRTKGAIMDKVKTVVLVGGIILIWTGTALLAWKSGEIIGSALGKVGAKATSKLVQVLS